jgi:hypothetical protein
MPQATGILARYLGVVKLAFLASFSAKWRK